MRSDLVFGASTNVPNRYLLSQLASKAARKFHKPGTRMQDTTNDILVRFRRANPTASEPALPEPVLVQLRRKMTRVIPHKSEVVPLSPARENSSPFANSSHSSVNSLTTTLGFQTYSDACVS
jgi:hypothetical protein